MSDPILALRDIKSFYGDACALHGITLDLNQGEMLALIGSNGAGKSTLLKTICGLIDRFSGDVSFEGQKLQGLSASFIARQGIALVPEGRRLFPSLSVEENLVIGGTVERPGPWHLQSIYELFPILKERRHQPSTSLSGGQQQMVAIGRALMANPKLLLLDELSLGLAPVIIKDIYALLPKILGQGLSAVLVEQDVTRALGFADRFICLQEGRVALEGMPGNFTREEISHAYFGA